MIVVHIYLGGPYFFTVATHRRRRLFHVAEHRALLGEAIRQSQQEWPFEINAIDLLPDHLHTTGALSPGYEQAT